MKLITDAAGRVHQVKVGQDTDKLFEMVMFLSEYAYERALLDVAMKLEDVLDSILHVEGLEDGDLIAEMAARHEKSVKEAAQKSTSVKRRLVSGLHTQSVSAAGAC